MKNILVLALSIISFFAQTKPLPPVEIATRTNNFESSDTILFKIETVSEIAYCKSGYDFIIDPNPTIGTEEITGNILNSSKGFDICYDNDGYDKFWIGLNRISVYLNGSLITYFYIDFRDCNYGNEAGFCNSNDISVLIDKNTGIWFSSGLTAEYEKLDDFGLINWWEVNSCSVRITHNFPNYWQNCLVVVSTKGEDGISIPYLIWGPIPNFNTIGYKIYWSYNSQGGPPGSFSLLTTVNSSTFEYKHEGLAVTGNSKVYYKIKAYNSQEESEFTNTAEMDVSGFFKKVEKFDNNQLSFAFKQNYPNPFNPTTTIEFTLPQSEFVKIKVFNQMGEEVALLVNGQMSSGTHSIDFDGSELASGIYFYQISAGKFKEVKKMMLLK